MPVNDQNTTQRVIVGSGKMHTYVFLLFLFIGSTLNKKQGDFGTFTACRYKNNSLRLDCSYGECQHSPKFVCTFTASVEFLKANTSTNCKPVLPDHRGQYRNKTTIYSCNLMRKGTTYVKNITINYSILKGKAFIKPCPDTTGLLMHRSPTLLWPVVVLSLWRVLSTDSQTT
ncbi:hypothetical protein NQZ68_013130 [Dissostichus eleginoides]|nr:hypothetical protein NQZ68_013130 [Dissostichus eleginoides]